MAKNTHKSTVMSGHRDSNNRVLANDNDNDNDNDNFIYIP